MPSQSYIIYIYYFFFSQLFLCSSRFKSFAYLYNEDQFIVSLAKDVKIVRTLPKYLKGARRKKEIPVFKVPYSASPFYYLRHVLPILKKHSVVELVVSNGGCLQVTTIYDSHIRLVIFAYQSSCSEVNFFRVLLFQAILPPDFEEYQRLRCRVSFQALQFRQEVQELSAKILQRQEKLHRRSFFCLFSISSIIFSRYFCF